MIAQERPLQIDASRTSKATPRLSNQRVTFHREKKKSLLPTMSITIRLEEAMREPIVTAAGSASQHSNRYRFPSKASIVLLGSRGAGKRSLGFIGAIHQARKLITDDHFFQQSTGLTKGAFLSQYGDQEYYKRSNKLLSQMLHENRSGCIIECGMASLTPEGQDILQKYCSTNPVVYVTRERERIRQLLDLGKEQAARWEPLYTSLRNCSNFEYYNLYDPSCDGTELSMDGSANPSRLKYAKEDFQNFLDILTGQGVIRSIYESPFSIAALPPEQRSYTYALSLRLSSVPILNLEELEAGADAVQLKIDSFLPDFQTTIARQVATIRRKLGVPVIFHAEENLFQGSNYSPPEKEDIYFSVLDYGLRLGVEYVVVDLKYSSNRISNLIAHSGRTKVIGHHLYQADDAWDWDDELRMEEYLAAEALCCDMVRFVRSTSKAEDNAKVRAFLSKINALPDHLPVIAYNLGENGRTSLVENSIFTPVTHPIMKSTVSLSQVRQWLLTGAEAVCALYKTSVLDPLHFYHLGASVFYSLSPTMHSAAYQTCGMSNDFQSLQVSTVNDIYRLCQNSNFGGAAITQPFKVQILSKLAAKSHHAQAIGAVNTLLPLRILSGKNPPDGSTPSLLQQANNRCKSGPVCAYYGDNTDFVGIMTCLRRNLSPRNAVQSLKTTGLVIGAGGMARAAIYAMIRLGCTKVFVWNRTVQNAETVAQHFNKWAAGLSSDGVVVRVLTSMIIPWPIGFDFPTMIVSSVPARSLSGQPPANIEIPVQWLGSPTGGVVTDVSNHRYKSANTH